MICISREDFFNESIIKTASYLKEEKIVIIPTDTVYGFSGIIKKNCEDRIKNIKGRGGNKPFIQLIKSPEDILLYTNDVIPEKLFSLWPGPLTIIVHQKENPQKTTAFRCPGDLWLREVIKNCGYPIYSTSVNRSGNAVLYNPSDIIEEFGNEVDLFVDAGLCKKPLPSTIVAINDDGSFSVVREGAIALSTQH